MSVTVFIQVPGVKLKLPQGITTIMLLPLEWRASDSTATQTTSSLLLPIRGLLTSQGVTGLLEAANDVRSTDTKYWKVIL